MPKTAKISSAVQWIECGSPAWEPRSNPCGQMVHMCLVNSQYKAQFVVHRG
uniref:Uncharacterized protein n=1 Tax=Arion vulgaris TaxID=1028688 RepID=A0A0B7AZC5_9EUPU